VSPKRQAKRPAPMEKRYQVFVGDVPIVVERGRMTAPHS
jgi:hypothetical protein